MRTRPTQADVAKGLVLNTIFCFATFERVDNKRHYLNFFIPSKA